MGFNEKAQVSTEVVLMIGIAVVGVVVFGALYLGDVNKNTRASTSIFVYDSNSSYVKWTSKNPIENTQQVISKICGDGVIRFPEQCDGTDLGLYTDFDCKDMGCGSGSISCNNDCTLNLNQCGLYPDCEFIEIKVRDCPIGFIPVPGNEVYGTTSGDYEYKRGFCVAKYEMKVDQDGDGIGDINNSCDVLASGIRSNNTAGCAYDNPGSQLVSSADGSPLTFLNRISANNACSSIGGGHLITNNEWMTIARNIEQVSSNWSGNAIGSGYIYSGHNDTVPGVSLRAAIDDFDGYYGTGNSSSSGANQRRTLALANGEVVWDMSGNIPEMLINKIQKKDMPDGFDINGASKVSNVSFYFDYSKASNSLYTFPPCGPTPCRGYYMDSNNLGNTTLTRDDLYLLNDTYQAKDNGIGRISSFSNPVNNPPGSILTDEFVFTRGGGYASWSDAGILALFLSSNSANAAGVYLGFRCVYVP